MCTVFNTQNKQYLQAHRKDTQMKDNNFDV